MRKVQMSASKGESLEQQLRPVERYAVQYLEGGSHHGRRRVATAIADFEEKEWELEQMEKQKAAAEAAEEDDELIIEGWETADATDSTARRWSRRGGAEPRRNANDWSANVGRQCRDALGGGGGGGNHGAGGGGGGGRRVECGRGRRSVRGEGASSIAERGPRPGRAAGALRVRFRGARGPRPRSVPGRRTSTPVPILATRSARTATATTSVARSGTNTTRTRTRPRRSAARRRPRRLSKEHDRAAAAAAMGGADGAIGTNATSPRVERRVAQRRDDDAAAPVRRLRRAPWRRGGRRPTASSTSSAARVGPPRTPSPPPVWAARVVVVQGSFPSAHRATRRRVGRGDGRGERPRHAELTDAAWRRRRDAFAGGGCRRGAVRQHQGHPVDDSARGGEDVRRRAGRSREVGDPSSDPRSLGHRGGGETSPPRTRGRSAREMRVWGHGEERRWVVIGVCVMRVTRARGATARGCARVGRRRGEGRY